MRIAQVLSTAMLAGSLAAATALTPAAAAWHGNGFHGHRGWGGAALGAGLALGALGALSAPYYYGYYGPPYGYDGPGCVQRYWWHGVWHHRYVC